MVVPPVTPSRRENQLKRSNRLVLLVGVFLAIVAFVGILLLVRNPSGQGATPEVPTTGPVVIAAVDIPLSTRIRAEQVTTQVVPLTAIAADAIIDPSQVIGQIVRQPVAKGAQLSAATFGGTSTGTVTQIATPVGLRSMAVQVDQVSGVGTVIKPGDYVDVVVGISADKFPVAPPIPPDAMNHTSVKLLIQGLQVLGTLLPPQENSAVAPTASGEPAPGTPSQPNTSLNGQQQIVILAVTPQQVEEIKFAQIDASISLVLRSPDDFIDPATGAPLPPVITKTSGIILQTLVRTYGVLPPEVVRNAGP
jgi:pilus assembly protein CpaB